MKAFETFATVQTEGEVHLSGLPFAPGTEVEVVVNPKRAPADEFSAQWKRVCEELRHNADKIADDEIQKEIDAYRAGE